MGRAAVGIGKLGHNSVTVTKALATNLASITEGVVTVVPRCSAALLLSTASEILAEGRDHLF